MRILPGPGDYHYYSMWALSVSVVCTCVYMHVCVEAWGQHCMSFLNFSPPLSFEIESLHQTWNSLIDRLSGPMSFRGLPASLPLKAWVIGTQHPCSAFYMGIRACKLRSWCLHAKHIIGWASPKWKYSTRRAQTGQLECYKMMKNFWCSLSDSASCCSGSCQL